MYAIYAKVNDENKSRTPSLNMIKLSQNWPFDI